MTAKSAKTSPKQFLPHQTTHPKCAMYQPMGVKVSKGPLLDGVGNSTKDIIQVSKAADADVVKVLKAQAPKS